MLKFKQIVEILQSQHTTGGMDDPNRAAQKLDEILNLIKNRGPTIPEHHHRKMQP